MESFLSVDEAATGGRFAASDRFERDKRVNRR
jgi:hypothetical protein